MPRWGSSPPPRVALAGLFVLLSLATSCAWGPPGYVPEANSCQPITCPEGTTLQTHDIPSLPDARLERCERPDGTAHGPTQTCEEDTLLAQGNFVEGARVGMWASYRDGQPVTTNYHSRSFNVVRCQIDGRREECEVSAMPLDCDGADLPRDQPILVSTPEEFAEEMGCAAPYSSRSDGDEIAWDTVRVALLRIDAPEAPDHLRYRAVKRMTLSENAAILKITFTGVCANTGYPRPPGDMPKTLQEVVTAIEVPRRIDRIGHYVSKRHSHSVHDCTTMP